MKEADYGEVIKKLQKKIMLLEAELAKLRRENEEKDRRALAA